MSVQAKFLLKRCCFFLFKAEGDTQRGLLLSALINASAGTQLGRVALPVWSRAVPCRRAWPLLQVSQLFAGREGTARRGQVSASLCSGRALPGNGEGGDSGVDCTAAHCSTPGTKICRANRARVAAVC